jgi:deoxyribonuclease IV
MARMLPDGRRLGAHLALGDGMVKAADRAAEIEASALQVFSDNPTAWQRRSAPSSEIPAFREHLDAAGIAPLAIHGSYLINLAGSDDELVERSIGLLVAELAAADHFGARFVNIHVGSHRGAGVEAGIERLAEGLVAAIEIADRLAEADGSADQIAPEGSLPGRSFRPGLASAGPVTITLENSAGGGWGFGVDIDELAAIAAAVDGAGLARDRLGFCLDTAHAWGAGIDLSDPIAADRFLGEFDDWIGLDRLHLIHLNDSKSELGSRTDRHEHLAAGRIGATGLAHLLRQPLLIGATYILETPGMDEGYDAINLARATALARGEALAPLPDGALTLRGSRSRAATPPADLADADAGNRATPRTSAETVVIDLEQDPP